MKSLGSLGKGGARQKRTKLYFRLMDLCLIASVLILASSLSVFGWVVADDGTVPSWYQLFGAVLLFFSFFVTPILILARFMRDEYAEQLFRRTTDILVYVAVALPFFVFWAATVVFLITRAETAPFPFSEFMIETTWWAAVAAIFKYFCILFVLIFQFLRWKDGR